VAGHRQAAHGVAVAHCRVDGGAGDFALAGLTVLGGQARGLALRADVADDDGHAAIGRTRAPDQVAIVEAFRNGAAPQHLEARQTRILQQRLEQVDGLGARVAGVGRAGGLPAALVALERIPGTAAERVARSGVAGRTAAAERVRAGAGAGVLDVAFAQPLERRLGPFQSERETVGLRIHAHDTAVPQRIQQIARRLELDVDGIVGVGIGAVGAGPKPVDLEPNVELVAHGQAPIGMGERDVKRLVVVDLEIERDAALVVARDVAVLESAARIVIDDSTGPGACLEGIFLGVGARDTDEREQRRPEKQADRPHLNHPRTDPPWRDFPRPRASFCLS
jgi:hypothetical protein